MVTIYSYLPAVHEGGEQSSMPPQDTDPRTRGFQLQLHLINKTALIPVSSEI